MEKEVHGSQARVFLVLVPVFKNPHKAPKRKDEVVKEECEDDITPHFRRQLKETGHPILEDAVIEGNKTPFKLMAHPLVYRDYWD